MVQTVRTSATSYCTAAEFLKRTDARVIGDLVSDAGTRTSAAALLTDVNLEALLLDASGLVEQACQTGGRYLPADLAALTGVALASLQRLVCRLTVVLAFERRPDRELKQPWIYEQADRDLELLAQGHRIFGFQEAAEAGVPSTRVETASDVEDRNGIVYQADRLFGRRSSRVDPR